MATKDVLEALCTQYEARSGQPVLATSIGGVDAAKKVRAGEQTDVVVLAKNAIDLLISDGYLLPGCRVDLVKSGIAVAVKQGKALPPLQTAQAVQDAVLAAKTVSYSTGPSGVYLEQLFTQWGIFEQIKPRIVLAPAGVAVGSLVAKGEADIGFQQYAELINVKGITLVGALPSDIQLITTFSAGILKTSSNQDQAKLLIDFLSSNEATATKEKSGMTSA